MGDRLYLLAYDIGTTGDKSTLFAIEGYLIESLLRGIRHLTARNDLRK